MLSDGLWYLLRGSSGAEDGRMLPRTPIPPALLDLIAAQDGAVSSRQAIDCGLTPKALRRVVRAWTTLSPGLHVVGDVTWRAFARAALLRGGPEAALGGAAAALVLGFIRQAPTMLTVRNAGKRAELVHGNLRAVYRRGRRRAWGQLRRTTAEEALLDLPGEADTHTVVEAITRACAQGATTPARLLQALGERERSHGRALVEQICTAAEEGVESVLEWLF